VALTQEVNVWREAGKHLPELMRDFHDQKDLFRTMHWMMGPPEEGALVRTPNEVEGHCYVVDRFLWFMARHGYTLQRSRAKLEFDDLQGNVAAMREEAAKNFAKLFGNGIEPAQTGPATSDAQQEDSEQVAQLQTSQLGDPS